MKNRVTICAVILFLFSSCCDFQGIEITLHRQKSAREVMLEAGTTEEHLPYLNSLTEGPKPKPPLPNDTVALFKFLDSDYYGIIGIGHPAQEFKVVFDTAWANMYVPSKLCGLTVPACWLLNKYDSKRSGTYKRNGTAFSVQESNHTISGFLSTDDVNLGHIKVKQQTFAEITQFPLMNVFSIVDGVLGMGFDALSINNVETVFSNIFKEKLIKEPIFAFYLNRDTTTPHGGSLMLGAADPKHYFTNTTVTVPVTSDYYWQFKINKIALDSGKEVLPFCVSGCQAVIDTSTRIIMGPPEDIIAINNFLQATSLVMNRYEIPCDQIPKLPRLNFTIGDRMFSMHGRDMVQQMTMRGISICLSVFVPTVNLPSPENSYWYLGSAFLQRAYVIFDMGNHAITFAQAK